MSKRTQIKTRDPQPQNRDPDVTNRPPMPATPAKRVALKCVPEAQTKCPECGFGSSCIDATRTDTLRGFVLKYRTCHACHARFASRVDTTDNHPKFPPVEGIDS